MKFDEALFEAGRSRFRAIFLTSLTTIAGLAPLLLEKSRQAQFLKPMAISISYGIGIATVLTLIMLPLMLSVVNNAKTRLKWLWSGKVIDREEVERVIKEMKTQESLDGKLAQANGTESKSAPSIPKERKKSTQLEEHS